jgi:DNA repair exonuclease SbcCD ATPase subunit
MNIKTIVVNHVRSLSSVRLAPGAGGMFLTGPNGAGKSAALESVQLALFGWTPRTGRSNGERLGKDADKLIADNAESADITLELDTSKGPVSVHVSLTRGGGKLRILDGDGHVMEMSRPDLWRWLGIDPRHAEICAMPAAFLDTKDLGGALADYLAEDVSVKAVVKQCAEHNAKWLARYLTSKGLECAMAPQSPADWLQVGKYAELDRRQAKKDLDGLVKPDPVEVPLDKAGNPFTPEHIPNIEGQIADLKRNRDQLLREQGAAGASRPREEVEADLAKVNVALEAAKTAHQTVADDLEAQEEALRAFQRDLSAVMGELSITSRNLDEAEGRIADAEAAVEAAKDAKCPTCGAKLAAAKVKAQQEQAQAALESWRQRRDEAAERLEEQRARQAAIDQSMADCKEAVQHARDRHAKTLPVYQEATGKARALQMELERCSGRSVEAIQADIDATNEKIARGEAIVAALDALRASQQYDFEDHRLRVEIERLDWAVEAFRDGALLKSMMGGKRDEFLTRVNAELSPFGYYAELDVRGKDVVVLLGRAKGIARDVALCSEGERWIAQFALAMAFSECDAPVMLDDMNHLDGRHKDHVRQRLQKCTGTVIVAGAWSTAKEPNLQALVGAFAPAQFVWLENGKVRAEQQVAA